uniref:Carboxyl methyltransferase n=2 Tax=Bixa orellana TaxID=66672 RepID=Q70T29_BIXOR|nr:carboxyl methyltransferase [Bixa orellana]
MGRVRSTLCMTGGTGDASYAQNSLLQRKALSKITKPLTEAAIKELYATIKPQTRLVIADLGCSSGPNTFLAVSELVDAVGEFRKKATRNSPEIQTNLNDLPRNDFNTLFRSVDKFNQKAKAVDEDNIYFVSGVPGSFYNRLFPSESIHFIHSSYARHWLSQVPKGRTNDAGLERNKGNIYIANSSPQSVWKAYLRQFQTDFANFLKIRSRENKPGGRMVLAFVGKDESPLASRQECCAVYNLLAMALSGLVAEGLLADSKVDQFNLPKYNPSPQEIMPLVRKVGSFEIAKLENHERQWESCPQDADGRTSNALQSGQNVAQTIRAVAEPALEKHFGDAIMEELFTRYAKLVAKHLTAEKRKFVLNVMQLTKKRHR